MYIDEKMLIKSEIPDEVDPSEWEVIEETPPNYTLIFIKHIYAKLVLFFKKRG